MSQSDREGRMEEPAALRRQGWIAALVLVAACAWVRGSTALADPGFDASSDLGMLKSDPGLLYYVAQRIVESDGLPPDDFRADPRVEHPGTTDVPALLAVGQEFLVAWARLLWGTGTAFHVQCVWVMAAWASLTLLGVYGLALELTRRARWALFAAVSCAALPASHRTLGFILVNEDFSVPFFAAHLWLAARASRVRTAWSMLAAGVMLGLACATWHAAGFLFALEAGCVLAWFLRTGVNPLAGPRGWTFAVPLVAAAIAVPVLWRTGFLLSLPMLVVLALVIAGRSRLVALGVLAGLFLLGRAVAGDDYGHVFGLLAAKLAHLGRLPDDPSLLPPEARLMWQGPFATLEPLRGAGLLGLGLLGILPAALFVVRRDARTGILCAFALLSLPVAWLVERTQFLPAMLLPVALACGLAALRREAAATLAACGIVIAQALLLAGHLRAFASPWYRPAVRQAEIAELVRRVPEVVPEGEAVAADFMNSTAILAHARRPIVFQPKWESRRSRERVIGFLDAFFRGTPEDMRRLLARYRCRYLLVDRYTLGILHASRYVAGIPVEHGGWMPGTCAAAFLDPRQDVPGFRLVYRSPPTIRQSDGSPADFFRLYEVSAPGSR